MANEFKVKNGIKFSDGTVQTTAATGGGGSGSSSVTIGTAPPLAPSAGDLWWDSTSGSLKIYYADETSSQWVDASPGATIVGSSSGNTGTSVSSGFEQTFLLMGA